MAPDIGHAVVEFLTDQGGMLLVGTTALLGAGAVAIRFQRSPIQRQRLGEIAVACTMVWIVLACVPMRRFLRAPEAAPGHAQMIVPSVPVLEQRFAARLTPRERPVSTEAHQVAQPVPRLAAPLSGHRPDSSDPDLTPRTARSSQAALDLPAELTTDVPPTQKVSGIAGESPVSISPRRAVAYVYLAGSAVSGAQLVFGSLLLARLVRRASVGPLWLRELYDSLDDVKGRRARLLVSERIRRPISCGVLRPVILLPAAVMFRTNIGQLRQVLLHELGHVRQRDARGNALLNLALPVLYFHPLYWLLRHDVHLARELIADDWAASRSGKTSYVAELVALARSAIEHRTALAGPFGQIALFRSPTNFYRRMHMLMQRREPLATSCPRAWRFATVAAFSAAVAIAAGVAGLEPARAQDAPSAGARTDESSKLKAELDATQKALQDTMKRLELLQQESAVSKDEQKLREVSIKQRMEQLLLESTKRADAEKRAAANGRPTASAAANTTGETRPAAGAVSSFGAGSGQLDLINLALGYIDAIGDAQTARARLDRMLQVTPNNRTNLELKEAEIAAQTAERKVKLLQGVIEIALVGAKSELENASRMSDAGLVSRSVISEAEAKYRILELILKSGQ